MAEPNPLDTSGLANSLADAIRRQADEQSNRGRNNNNGGGGQPKSPLDQLIEQIQSINVEATPYETLLQQATGAAGAEYDPLIAQLESEIASTTKRGEANQQEARDMYNALAQDIAAEMPQITNQMAQASQATEQRYNQTQQELQQQYSQQAQAQAELFKQLGIQAAAPEASQQAMEDQAYYQQQSQTEEDAALRMLEEMENADISYNRQTAQNTRLAGENTAQDIASQLEEYLAAANSKLTGLEAGRSSAISAMLAELQQSDAERINEAEQNEYDQLMDLFKLQQEMESDASQSSLFSGTSGPSGASNYLSEIYGPNDSFTSDSIMEAINDVMSTPQVVAGEYETENTDQYGNPVVNEVTDEYMMDLLRQRLQEGDLNPDTSPLFNTQYSTVDVNNAINALLAYLGKLE